MVRTARRRAAALALLVLVALAVVVGVRTGDDDDRRTGSILDVALRDPTGSGALVAGPGEPLRDRRDLLPGGTAAGDGAATDDGDPGLGGSRSAPPRPGRTLGTVAQLTDTHVRDTASPARIPFLDRLGAPFTPIFRPQEPLTLQTLAAATRTVNALGPDLTVVTGDLADNAQQNELDAAIAVLRGGRVRPFDASALQGGRQRRPVLLPPRRRPAAGAGPAAPRRPPVRRPRAARPRRGPSGQPRRPRRRRGRGDPGAPGRRGRRAAARHPGPRVRPDDPARRRRRPGRRERPARGRHPARHHGRRPPGPHPPPAHGPRRRLAPRRRRAGGRPRRARRRGARRRPGRPRDPAGRRPRGPADVDTEDPGQVAFLDRALRTAGDRWVLVAVHDPLDRTARGRAIRDRIARAPRVLATIGGDTHHDRIRAVRTRAGGHWALTTSALADWPQQGRALRVRETAGGGAVLETWKLDTAPDPLGDVARELAHLDAQGGRPGRNAGTRSDRNVRLYKPPAR